MIQGIINTPQYKTLNSFSKRTENRGAFLSHRYHKTRPSEKNEQIKVLTGAVLGTVIPLLYFATKQNKNIFNIKYGLKEIAGVSGGSIAGGVLGGIVVSNKEERRQKLHEGIFQYSNAVIPAGFVCGFEKLLSKTKFSKNIFAKAGSMVSGIALGTISAVKFANFACDPLDKMPDRKLTIKDSVANLDDAIGALAIAKLPMLDKIPVEKILPLIYIFCGSRAGDSN